jgi:hypothetical protein
MADLYDNDFFAWTRQQAALLRARAANSNVLEWDRLADEIEELGRYQSRACEIQVAQILLNFLKLSLARDRGPERVWRAELVSCRIGMRRHLSPSLKARLQGEVEDQYQDARRLFLAQMDDADLTDAPPTTCPWTFYDVLGRGYDWAPHAGFLSVSAPGG